MDQDATWFGGRPWPRRLCVRWGPTHSKKGAQPPSFRPMCIVAKQLHGLRWLHGTLVVRIQPNLAPLNRGRHLYSAGRPSRWALAHVLVMMSNKFHTCNTAFIVLPFIIYIASLKLVRAIARILFQLRQRRKRGSGGRAPSRVQGQSPWSACQGAKPPEAESFLVVG